MIQGTYIASNIESWPKTIQIPNKGRLLNSTMNVNNLELVRNSEIRNYVTHKQDVLSVYCWQVILFDSFFITLMFVYLQKPLHCLIIYSYKTNSSFSPCPWRSIGRSNLKDCWMTSKNDQHFAWWLLHAMQDKQSQAIDKHPYIVNVKIT